MMSEVTPIGVATDNGYRNNSQQTLIAVIEALAADPLQAKSLAGLPSELATNRDQVFRALKNLEMVGWVEQCGDAWRLSARVTLLSENLRRAIADLHHTYLEPKK